MGVFPSTFMIDNIELIKIHGNSGEYYGILSEGYNVTNSQYNSVVVVKYSVLVRGRQDIVVKLENKIRTSDPPYQLVTGFATRRTSEIEDDTSDI